MSRSSRKATVAKSIRWVGPGLAAVCQAGLVGDSGQVLEVLGWALTGIRNLPFVLQCCRNEMSTVAVCGTEL